MTESPGEGKFWERYTDGDGAWRSFRGARPAPPPGAALAALRRGTGRPAGTVPALWPYYTVEATDDYVAAVDEWRPPPALVAEHHALVLYGWHQQSIVRPMHRRDVGVGAAVRALHTTNRYTQSAVDGRFFAAVTTDDVDELAVHLRGLVAQLRTLRHDKGGSAPQPLDYTRLVRDLSWWPDPEKRNRVRRRWGLDYHRWRPDDEGASDGEVAEAG